MKVNPDADSHVAFPDFEAKVSGPVHKVEYHKIKPDGTRAVFCRTFPIRDFEIEVISSGALLVWLRENQPLNVVRTLLYTYNTKEWIRMESESA